MKFAYLINAHKNAKHVKRLVDRLNNDRTSFVIHVSKSCEDGFWSEIKKITKSYSNVYFCKREKSVHTGFAIVQATINGMQTFLDKNIEFDYFHLLSGQDYPIKKNEEIFDFFEENSGKEFMSFWKMFPEKGEPDYENHPWGVHRQEFRLNRFNIPWRGKTIMIPELESGRLIDKPLLKTIKIFLFELRNYKKEGRLIDELGLLFFSRILPNKRKYDVDFTFYGGKTWFSFSHEVIQYIVNEHKNNSKWKKFFKFSIIPDEMYFHSIVMNSKFATNVVNDYKREVEWGGGDGFHPIVWKKSDFSRLTASTNFWARKFEDSIDSEILDLIDTRILEV